MVRDRLTARLAERAASLSASSRRVAAYIDAHRVEAMTKTAAELAQAIGTSDATVVRAVQALGFSGLPELKRDLAATFGRGVSPADNMQRTLSIVEGGVERGIDFVLSAQQAGVNQASSHEMRTKLAAAARVLKEPRRIAVFGIGPTAFLAGYAGMMLTRNGKQCHVLTGTGSSLADQLLQLSGCEALLIMAYGRAYGEAAATMEEGRRLKLPIVLISDSLDQSLARHADVIVPAPRGLAEQVALHGTTLACLEALIVGIAAADQRSALATLETLSDFRKAIAPAPKRSS